MTLEQFHYICDIIPEQTDGNINEFYPQSRYNNEKELKLHAYGSGSFCKFKIPNNHKKAGVYAIIVDGSPKYIGKCKNLSARFNSGYGNISPRNCYTPRGQPTNCRLNRLILDTSKKGKQIKLYFQETENRSTVEANLIQKLHSDWNRTQGTKKTPRNENQQIKSNKFCRSKYYPLQKYLENSSETKKTLKYSEIEEMLGFELPNSAYEYGAWWSNGSHTQANAWLNAGWLVFDVCLGNSITFKTKSSWDDVAIIDGKKVYWQCGTPFIQVRPKKNKNKIICRKCGQTYSITEARKIKFCTNCQTFLALR
jgi:hypothetical protein